MMIMKVNDLITLNDNSNYLLLDEIIHDKDKYFFCVKVDEEKTKPINDYVFIKGDSINNQKSVTIIKDNSLIDVLYDIVLKNFINS